MFLKLFVVELFWSVGGRGEKETLIRKPHDFEKLHLPTNAASDWCSAGSVG